MMRYMYILQNDHHYKSSLTITIRLHLVVVVTVMRIFKFYSLSNSQIYNKKYGALRNLCVSFAQYRANLVCGIPVLECGL